MDTTSEKPNRIHQGRNVKRFREMLGLKQEALALALGEEWSQKWVSLLEAKETLDADQLTEVAKALKVPEEAIKNFDEEKAINNIRTNYDSSTGMINYGCTFNLIDKIVELYSEKVVLLERLLLAEKEKVELLKNK